jgi:hypothetical protein
MRFFLAIALAALPGCAPSDDPAEGGFYSGIAGLAGGGYDARIAEREAGVSAAEARGEVLSAELAALQGEHARLKSQIIQQRADLRAQGVRLSPDAERRIQAVLAEQPAATDPSARAAVLQRAIADARQLSEQLAALSG